MLPLLLVAVVAGSCGPAPDPVPEGGTCGVVERAAFVEVGGCASAGCLPPIRTWALQVDPDDWAELAEEIYEDSLWFDCELTVDGVTYPGCEVRIQGASSRYFPKTSVRLRFPEGADHPGFSRNINLRAEWADRTFLRTWLGYETFRRLSSLPTPRARPLFMTLNGEDYGVMMEVERIGGSFLSHNGRDRERSLYEAERAPPYGGLMPMEAHDEYRYLDGDELYSKKAGDKDDYSDLISLVEESLWPDFLDSPSRSETVVARTGEVVRLQPQVQYLALNVLVQNRDHVQSNFHFSIQRDVDGRDRWEFYPWDLDSTFGCHRAEGYDQTLCDVMTYSVWPYGGVAPDEDEPIGAPHEVWMNLLIHLALNHPGCDDGFRSEVCSMLDSAWWTSDFASTVDAMADQLAPWVERDAQDRSETLADFRADVELLRGFPALRAEYLRAELGCE